MMRSLLLLVLATLTGLALVPAVRAAQDGDEVRVHMKVVRDRRADLEQRIAAMDALLELGTEGPRQLAVQLGGDLKKLRRVHAKDAGRLLGDFAKEAGKVLAKRLDRKALKEVEERREAILKNTRSRGLTKEQIVAESDPALARLEELLAVTVEQVFEAEDELAPRVEALQGMLGDEAVLFDYWVRARESLEALPNGERIAKRLKAPDDPTGEGEALTAALARAAKLATPMPDADRKVFEDNQAVREKLQPTEASCTETLNLMRVHLGLRALRIDPLLCNAGRDHSKDMVELDFFSHTSPVKGKESPAKRAALAGTSGGAENIAIWHRDVGVMKQWWHSPGHHKNMLGNHARVGLGRHESHWTQMFGK